MKKLILAAAVALCLPLGAFPGDISIGAVPGSINYQGRLERDNAPITGIIHLHFRIYNSATGSGAGACGGINQPCLWMSNEIPVDAAQGVFSATLTPPITVFSSSQQLYLEVQVESDVLAPREPLNSVAYALVAKRLEDGSSVSLSSLTAAYQVFLATTSGNNVGIGTISPAYKLTVNGSIKMMGVTDKIYFQDGTSMGTAGVGDAVGGVTSPGGSTIESGTGGSGMMSFKTSQVERMRIADSSMDGRVGIGTAAITSPMGTLDVDGALYVGNEGIYDRDDSELNIKQDLVVEGGKIRGTGNNYLSMGETADTLVAATGNTPRLWLDSSGNLGVGAAAAAGERVHSNGNLRADKGVRGDAVSIGSYSGWATAPNEVRSQDGSDLLLQQSNQSFNVGIGTAAPREKLHVHGTVRADYGIAAATATFSGDVRMTGDLTVNGNNHQVYLTSTTIYGSLQVNGEMNSPIFGSPAYKSSTQTFTGLNTFLHQVVVSSDILTLNRIGAGVSDFDFPDTKYLQVGDSKTEFAHDNAIAYLVGGSAANAKLDFYRGGTEAARFETQNGANLALVVNGQTKTLTDATYHRIQNSVVWISTGYASTPSIFVSSWMGNVGMGTSVMDPNWRLTVNGNIRISGTGSGLIFPDGTSLLTGNLSATTVGGVSSNGNAVVQSDADLSGTGSVVLRAGSVDGLTVNSGGNVGIGTLDPISKLNIRGGDLVLGTPVTYPENGIEDLIVAGDIVFDGALVQRSVSMVNLSNLLVAGNVYLSTAPGAMTGIGNTSPGHSLDVTGDINASGSVFTGGTARISNTGIIGSGGTNTTWDGATINVNRGGTGSATLTAGAILYGNGTSAIGMLPVLPSGQLLIGNGAGAPTEAGLTGTLKQITVTPAAGSITLSLPQNIDATATPVFAGITVGSLTGVIKGAAGVFSTMNGTANYSTYWSDANTIAAEQYTALSRGGSNADLSSVATGSIIYKAASALAATGSLTGMLRGNGTAAPDAMTGTANTLVKWGTGGSNIINSLITDDGTNVNMNGHAVINVSYPSANTDAATKVYVDDATGSGSSSRGWNKNGNSLSGGEWLGSNDGINLVFKTNSTTAMTITTGQYIQLTHPLEVAYGGTGNTTGNAATVTTNANLNGVVTSVGNTTSIGIGAITNAMLANTAVANLSNTNTGDETAATIRTKIGAAAAGNDGYLSQGNWTTFNNKQPAGNYITGLTGDVTAAGPGSVGATIANGAVTLAKMASMATASFIGRNSGGAGAPEVLAAATVKTMLNLSGTNSGDQTDITGNAGTATKPQVSGTATHAVCWKADGSLGSCSTVVSGTGTCTCS